MLFTTLAFPGPTLGKVSVVPYKNPVNDYAAVLPEATQTQLNALLRNLQDKTGAQIAVVVIPSTEGIPPADYAVEFGHKWGVGQKGKDNGVVFLVAVQDREMFIATGYGVESILPDGKVGRIRDDEILPHFRRGDMAGGIVNGTLRLAGEIARAEGVGLDGLAPSRNPNSRRVERRGSGYLPLILLFFFLIPMLFGRRQIGLLPFLMAGSGMRMGGFGGGFQGGFGGGFSGGLGGGFGGGGGGGRW